MSMLNTPGNVLRGAADFLPTIRRPNLRGLLNNSDSLDWKATLQVKGTPSKDAETMSQFAVRKGYLQKKNEQGQFHWRYVCTVPHMFLYYYDTDHSEAPRGIIDLELFTKIDIEGDENNILKLAVDEDSPQMRSFYFEMDNPNELSDWVTSILRDRYSVVKEERDAYRNLSDQFSGEMDTATKQKAVSTHDMGKLQADISTCKKNFCLLFDTVKGVLDVIGVFDDEGQDLEDNREAADHTYQTKSVQWVQDSLMSAMINLKEGLEKTNRLEKEEADRQAKDMQDRIAVLELRLSEEQEARHKLQQECDVDKKTSEIKLRQAFSKMDQSSLNLQAAVATKCVVEQNAKKLQDQKKVLVKEVKLLRSKVEELNTSQAVLTEKLTHLLEHPPQEAVTVGGTVSPAKSAQSLTALQSPQGTHDCDSDDEDIDEEAVTTADSDQGTPMSEGDSASLEWLDPEQRLKLQNRHRSPVPGADTLCMVKNFGIGDIGECANEDKDDEAVAAGTSAAEDPSGSMSMSQSLALLGNVFHISNDTPSKAPAPLLSVHDEKGVEAVNQTECLSPIATTVSTDNAAAGGGISGLTSPADASTPPIGSSEPPSPAAASAFVLKCLRCQGTVEGPKNSTCKCAEPALTPDQLNDSSFNSDAAVSSVSNAWKSVAASGRRFSMMSGAFSSSTASSSGGKDETPVTSGSETSASSVSSSMSSMFSSSTKSRMSMWASGGAEASAQTPVPAASAPKSTASAQLFAHVEEEASTAANADDEDVINV